VVEESEITSEHDEHARVPTEGVSECYGQRCDIDIPNKNEKDEAQAIQNRCAPVRERPFRSDVTSFLPTST
jgi:hypothetical protein